MWTGYRSIHCSHAIILLVSSYREQCQTNDILSTTFTWKCQLAKITCGFQPLTFQTTILPMFVWLQSYSKCTDRSVQNNTDSCGTCEFKSWGARHVVIRRVWRLSVVDCRYVCWLFCDIVSNNCSLHVIYCMITRCIFITWMCCAAEYGRQEIAQCLTWRVKLCRNRTCNWRVRSRIPQTQIRVLLHPLTLTPHHNRRTRPMLTAARRRTQTPTER